MKRGAPSGKEEGSFPPPNTAIYIPEENENGVVSIKVKSLEEVLALRSSSSNSSGKLLPNNNHDNNSIIGILDLKGKYKLVGVDLTKLESSDASLKGRIMKRSLQMMLNERVAILIPEVALELFIEGVLRIQKKDNESQFFSSEEELMEALKPQFSKAELMAYSYFRRAGCKVQRCNFSSLPKETKIEAENLAKSLLAEDFEEEEKMIIDDDESGEEEDSSDGTNKTTNPKWIVSKSMLVSKLWIHGLDFHDDSSSPAALRGVLDEIWEGIEEDESGLLALVTENGTVSCTTVAHAQHKTGFLKIEKKEGLIKKGES